MFETTVAVHRRLNALWRKGLQSEGPRARAAVTPADLSASTVTQLCGPAAEDATSWPAGALRRRYAARAVIGEIRTARNVGIEAASDETTMSSPAIARMVSRSPGDTP